MLVNLLSLLPCLSNPRDVLVFDRVDSIVFVILNLLVGNLLAIHKRDSPHLEVLIPQLEFQRDPVGEADSRVGVADESLDLHRLEGLELSRCVSPIVDQALVHPVIRRSPEIDLFGHGDRKRMETIGCQDFRQRFFQPDQLGSFEPSLHHVLGEAGLRVHGHPALSVRVGPPGKAFAVQAQSKRKVESARNLVNHSVRLQMREELHFVRKGSVVEILAARKVVFELRVFRHLVESEPRRPPRVHQPAVCQSQGVEPS